MPKIDYTITDTRALASADPQRAGKLDLLISWVEDGLRHYALFVPQEQYSPAEAIKRVEAAVAEHAKVIGHTGSVGG